MEVVVDGVARASVDAGCVKSIRAEVVLIEKQWRGEKRLSKSLRRTESQDQIACEEEDCAAR